MKLNNFTITELIELANDVRDPQLLRDIHDEIDTRISERISIRQNNEQEKPKILIKHKREE